MIAHRIYLPLHYLNKSVYHVLIAKADKFLQLNTITPNTPQTKKCCESKYCFFMQDFFSAEGTEKFALT
jgi:hypothetical protein